MHAFDKQAECRTEMPWQYRALHYMQSRGKNYLHMEVAAIDI